MEPALAVVAELQEAQQQAAERQEALQQQAAEVLPAALEQVAALLPAEPGALGWLVADRDSQAVERERLPLEARLVAAGWLRAARSLRAAGSAARVELPADELRSGWPVREQLVPAAPWLQAAE